MDPENYAGSDAAHDSHPSHDHTTSEASQGGDDIIQSAINGALASNGEANDQYYHKNEVTLPIHQTEVDYMNGHGPQTKESHYMSTANLDIKERLVDDGHMDKMEQGYNNLGYEDTEVPLRNGKIEDINEKKMPNGTEYIAVRSSFNNSKPINGDYAANDGHMNEMVNLELINLKPMNNGLDAPYEVNSISEIPVKKGNDDERRISYDEYFVPVNEHRKYMRGEKLYVTADKRSKKSRSKYLCWILCICIVATALIIGILAAVGVIGNKTPIVLKEMTARHFDGNEPTVKGASIFGNIDSKQEDSPPQDVPLDPIIPTTNSQQMIPRVLESEITIDNKLFVPELYNKNSPEYQHLAKTIEDQLKNYLLTNDILQNELENIEVKIMEFLPGSIVAKFRVAWNYKEHIYNSKNDIDNEIAGEINDIRKNNRDFIDEYHLAPKLIQSEKINDMCQNNNNGCQYKCEFDYAQHLDFICTCPEGKGLDEDGKSCITENSAVLDESETHMNQHEHFFPITDQSTSEAYAVASAEPSAEPAAEPNAEPTAEPNAEPAAEPSAEPNAEPATEPSAEPTAEPNAEPSAEPTAEPKAEPAAEPSAEPTAEPAAEPSAEPTAEPNAEPAAEPNAEPASEPSAEPTAEPNAEPAAEPSAEPTPEPNAEPAAELPSEPAAEPTTEQAVEPAVEPAAEPTAEPSAEPTAETNAEPAAEPSAEPTAEPNAEPAAEPSAEPTAEPSVEPNAEPAAEPSTEPTAELKAETPVELAAEPSAESDAEPTAEPAAEPTVEPTAEPPAEPAAEPTAESAAEPSAEPAPEPSAEPTAEPSAEPAAEPTAEPNAETTVKPTSESAVAEQSVASEMKHISESIVESSTEPAAEPTAEPSTEPLNEVDNEPTSEHSGVPLVEPNEEPTAEPVAEPSAEHIAEPSSEAIPEPTTEPLAKTTSEEIVEPSKVNIEPVVNVGMGSIVETSTEPAELIDHTNKVESTDVNNNKASEIAITTQLSVEPTTKSSYNIIEQAVTQHLTEPIEDDTTGNVREESTEKAPVTSNNVSSDLEQNLKDTVTSENLSTEHNNNIIIEPNNKSAEPNTETIIEQENSNLMARENTHNSNWGTIIQSIDEAQTTQATSHLNIQNEIEKTSQEMIQEHPSIMEVTTKNVNKEEEIITIAPEHGEENINTKEISASNLLEQSQTTEQDPMTHHFKNEEATYLEPSSPPLTNQKLETTTTTEKHSEDVNEIKNTDELTVTGIESNLASGRAFSEGRSSKSGDIFVPVDIPNEQSTTDKPTDDITTTMNTKEEPETFSSMSYDGIPNIIRIVTPEAEIVTTTTPSPEIKIAQETVTTTQSNEGIVSKEPATVITFAENTPTTNESEIIPSNVEPENMEGLATLHQTDHTATENMSPFLPEIENDTFVNILHSGDHWYPFHNETERAEYDEHDQKSAENPEFNDIIENEIHEKHLDNKLTVTTPQNDTDINEHVIIPDTPTVNAAITTENNILTEAVTTVSTPVDNSEHVINPKISPVTENNMQTEMITTVPMIQDNTVKEQITTSEAPLINVVSHDNNIGSEEITTTDLAPQKIDNNPTIVPESPFINSISTESNTPSNIITTASIYQDNNTNHKEHVISETEQIPKALSDKEMPSMEHTQQIDTTDGKMSELMPILETTTVKDITNEETHTTNVPMHNEFTTKIQAMFPQDIVTLLYNSIVNTNTTDPVTTQSSQENNIINSQETTTAQNNNISPILMEETKKDETNETLNTIITKNDEISTTTDLNNKESDIPTIHVAVLPDTHNKEEKTDVDNNNNEHNIIDNILIKEVTTPIENTEPITSYHESSAEDLLAIDTTTLEFDKITVPNNATHISANPTVDLTDKSPIQTTSSEITTTEPDPVTALIFSRMNITTNGYTLETSSPKISQDINDSSDIIITTTISKPFENQLLTETNISTTLSPSTSEQSITIQNQPVHNIVASTTEGSIMETTTININNIISNNQSQEQNSSSTEQIPVKTSEDLSVDPLETSNNISFSNTDHDQPTTTLNTHER